MDSSLFTVLESSVHQEHATKETNCLPIDYKLGINDVYCGRGSLCFYHYGNKQFRSIVSANVQRYNEAKCKFQKSAVIKEVIEFIGLLSPAGRFVKRDDACSRFYQVSDMHAREKTSQAFRDLMEGKYKSSRLTKSKRVKITSVPSQTEVQYATDDTCNLEPSSFMEKLTSNFVVGKNRIDTHSDSIEKITLLDARPHGWDMTQQFFHSSASYTLHSDEKEVSEDLYPFSLESMIENDMQALDGLLEFAENFLASDK